VPPPSQAPVKSRPKRPARASRTERTSLDSDSLPLIVPRFDRPLLPIVPDRVRRLRKNLLDSLRAATEPCPPATVPEIGDFTARVIDTACALCRGWCCRQGGEHAYLDERTLARVCLTRPGLDVRAVLRLYLERVPAQGYENSCVFHGQNGCTLGRSLRSDVCNNYFCGGLGAFVAKGHMSEPVVVMAGDGSNIRTSPIIRP